MFIVVGLGNPGREYMFTRHNAGFLALDILSKQIGVNTAKSAHKSLVCQGTLAGQKIILVKPQTFMNNSGQAVVELINWYKVDPKDSLIVVYDDVDLEVGVVRVRSKGSAGTHNGMRSIIVLTGRDDFARVRIGIGKRNEPMALADYVLGQFAPDEKETIYKALENAAGAVQEIVKAGVEEAQRKYNGKSE